MTVISVSLKQALEKAEEIDKTLQATSPDFLYTTSLVLDDGSVRITDSSFFLEYNDYLLLFSEHHGFDAFHKDDVVSYRMFKSASIKKI